MTSVNWELPTGRHVIASGTQEEVLGTLTHVVDLETRLLILESQMTHVEEMAASVLQLEKIGRRLVPKEKTA